MDSGMGNGMERHCLTDESRFCLHHPDGPIRDWRHRDEKCCVMNRLTGPALGLGGIGFQCRTPIVRIVGTLNS
ncbi:hypothetical protein TNCV_4263481 [Trichonephila clavipes]|nr:hypothetical protein TNCV_4263481 [Trichonephila clavipes]